MVLRKSRLRLTEAIFFGKTQSTGGSVTSITQGSGITATPNPITGAGTIKLGPLTTDWLAGNFSIKSHNSVDWVNAAEYPLTNVGLQSAINATPLGGVCYMPAGTWLISATLNITQQMTLLGAGVGTIMEVQPALGAGNDVIHLTPGISDHGYQLSSFSITASAPPLGRHGIHIDGSVASTQNLLIDRIFVNGAVLNGRAIFADGNGGGNGTPAQATIQNSMLGGGISMLNCGDSVRILNNFSDTPALSGGPVVDIAYTVGASTLEVMGNFLDCSAGAIRIGSISYNAIIAYNRLENGVATAPRFIDLTGGPSNETIITGNSFQNVAGGAGTMVYVDNAAKTNIYANRFDRGGNAAARDIVITAAATDTIIGSNEWVDGAPFTSMVQDAGTGTVVNTAWQGNTIVNPVGGYVGIGSTAPLVALHVVAPSAQGNVSLFATHDYVSNTTGTMYLFGFGAASGNTYCNFGTYTVGGAAPASLAINATGGPVGIWNTNPTRTLDVNGVERLRGIAAPAVSEANSATLYFDTATNTLKASQNGGAYVNILGSGGLTGTGVATKLAYWDSPTDLTDAPGITLGGSSTIDIDPGDVNLGTNGGIFTPVIRIGGFVGVKIATAPASCSFGTFAGDPDTMGGGSTAIGVAAAQTATGVNTTAVGQNAGGNLTTAIDTTAVGRGALVRTTTGGDNTAVGFDAGLTNTVGANNVFIGSQADANANNYTNAVAIGYQAVVGASDSMVLGNGTMNVGVRTSTPKVPMDVNGAFAIRHHDVALVNGANQNVVPTLTSWVRITGPSAPFSIGGFTDGVDGRIMYIRNTTAFQMTLNHLDAGSVAANQIFTPTAAPINCSVATLIYEDASDVWVVQSYF